MALVQSKQILLKQVSTDPPRVQPKQIEASAPVLTVTDLTQQTGSVVVFDTLLATVTSDELTTGVDLYDGITLIGPMVEGPSGTWTLMIESVTEGSHDYVAEKVWPGTPVPSNIVSLTALGSLSPDEITTATLLAWYRSPESFQLHTTLFGSGTNVRTITVASSSSLNGRSEGILIDIIITGLPGAGTFDISINNGTTILAAGVTIPDGAGTYAIPTTDLALTFQQGVSYNADNVYRGTISALLDKVGAYPASANNFINDASSGGAASRPRTVAATFSPNPMGAAMLRFDANLGAQGFLWCTAGSIATAFSGLDKTFAFMFVAQIQQAMIPVVGGQRRDFYCVSNLTDVDQPRITLGVPLFQDTTGQPGVFRANRVSDTGVNKVNSSGGGVFAGSYFIEDSFDGVHRRVTANAADMIGGDSGVVADQSGQTITTTRMVLGTNQGQAGKTNGASYDLAEWMIWDQLPTSEVELWQLRAYVLE